MLRQFSAEITVDGELLPMSNPFAVLVSSPVTTWIYGMQLFAGDISPGKMLVRVDEMTPATAAGLVVKAAVQMPWKGWDALKLDRPGSFNQPVGEMVVVGDADCLQLDGEIIWLKKG
jgi:hypothetical protein